MEVDSQSGIDRSVKHFFMGTFLSRILGMCRDMVMTFFFGTIPMIAAFYVAYRFSHIFRRLFGEGAIHTSFVPYFENVRKDNREKGALFFRDLFFTLFVVLSLFILFAEMALYFSSHFFETRYVHILKLSMLMLPGLLFICLYGISSSLVQCQKKFFQPSLAPIFFNLLWILAAYIAHYFSDEKAAYLLSMGIVIAYIAQWLFVFMISLRSLDVKLSLAKWLKPKLFSYECRKLIKPFSLGIIGVAAVQINSLADSVFAIVADPSGPAYLWNAIRIEQLPVALFGVALSGALLPPLSRAFERKDQKNYDSFLRKSLLHAAYLLIPVTFGIFALSGVSINLLFGRGAFTMTAVMETQKALQAYGIGLFPHICVLLLSVGFYAKKNFVTPTIASVISVLMNLVLNSFFVFVLKKGAISIAIATSIASFLNAAILAKILLKQHKNVIDFSWIKKGGIVFLSSISAFFLTYLFERALFYTQVSFSPRIFFPRNFLAQSGEFFAMSLFFITTFFLLSYLFRAKDMLQYLRRQFLGFFIKKSDSIVDGNKPAID